MRMDVVGLQKRSETARQDGYRKRGQATTERGGIY